jgi:hypothetical protein
MGQVMAWFMEELPDPPAYHRTWAILEFVAAFALEHQTRAFAGRMGVGLAALDFGRLLDDLGELLASTPDAVIESPERCKEDPLWRLAERFIIGELHTPIVSTDEQEQLLLELLSADQSLFEELTATVGFDSADAVVIFRTLTTLAMEAMRAWGAATSGLPFHVAGCQLSDYLCFGVADLVERGIDYHVAAGFCEAFSQRLGSSPMALPGLTSSLRNRPLLSDGQGRMLCVALPLLLRAIRPRLRSMLNPDIPEGRGSPAGFRRWIRQENRIVAMLAEAHLQRMGFQATGCEAKWRTAHDNSDIDVWAQLEQHLLTLQIKTGRLRGWRSINTFEGDVRKLVGEAIEQHERFHGAFGGEGFAWSSPHPPVAGRREQLTPIVLTLEDVSGCAVVSARLRDAGLVSGALPWIISLAQFEQALELLELPAVLMNFLDRRAKLSENQLFVVADELDLVLEYLSHGLELAVSGSVSFQGQTVQGISAGQPFRAYQAWLEGERGIGPPAPKPALSAPDKMLSLLGRLDRDRPEGFLAMSIALLDLPRVAWSRIAMAWDQFDVPHTSAAIQIADPAFLLGDGSAIGFTLLRWSAQERDEDGLSMILTRYCAVQKYRAKADRWYGILIPPDPDGSVGPITTLESPWREGDPQISWPPRATLLGQSFA